LQRRGQVNWDLGEDFFMCKWEKGILSGRVIAFAILLERHTLQDLFGNCHCIWEAEGLMKMSPSVSC
jgi:hypothetical protein